MAWRDTRRSRARLLVYSSSIVLGVAALVAVGSLGENLRSAVEMQAKSLLGADLALVSNGPLSPEASDFVARLGGTQAREVSFTSMVFFPKTQSPRLAQVRALEEGFPFYGTFETVPQSAAAQFRTQGGALVEDSLMRQFAAEAGDPIKVGESVLRISGSLHKVPGEMAAFGALAPRVYIGFNELEKTGLLQKGSLIRRRVYFKFGPEVDVPQLVKRLRPQLERLQLQADTVEHRKRDLGRAMTNLYYFLNLVGFVALLLGGIGIASAIRVHVAQKLPTVAILRSLGCTAGESFAVYLAQGIGLGCIGVGLGAAVGIGIQMALPVVLADFVPIPLPSSLSVGALLRGVGVGFGVCFLFALLPMLAVRRVPPLAVLRVNVEGAVKGRDVLVYVCYGLLVAGLVAFSISQSQRWEVGLGFAAGVGVAFGALALVAQAILRTVRRLTPRIASFSIRHGLASVHRPNNRTGLLMFSLGLGTFLILTLYLAQENLARQVLPGDSDARPDAVLFDIQADQRTGVTNVLHSLGLPVLQETPVVTMRLAEVKGKSAEQLRKDPRRPIAPWALRREYRSTYRENLEDTEKIVAGSWTGRVANGVSPIPVSVEDGIARTLHVGLGDELVFDVQGIQMRTVVASLREVDWRRLQPNFFVVFPAGVLEDAPSFFVVVTRAGASERSAEMQRAMVKEFPNVSTIDLGLVLETVDSILRKVSFVMRFMASFTVGTGLLVLVASLLTGRYQRLQESILLRTLGASRRQMGMILLVEYLALGALAALTGLLLAVASSWALARFVFKVDYVFLPWPLLASLVIVSGLTVLTGLATSRGICGYPPLEVLRREG